MSCIISFLLSSIFWAASCFPRVVRLKLRARQRVDTMSRAMDRLLDSGALYLVSTFHTFFFSSCALGTLECVQAMDKVVGWLSASLGGSLGVTWLWALGPRICFWRPGIWIEALEWTFVRRSCRRAVNRDRICKGENPRIEHVMITGCFCVLGYLYFVFFSSSCNLPLRVQGLRWKSIVWAHDCYL